MNDYEYAFMQDVKEKKLAATGARHRATRGTRSFAVHNQSDYLTKKEVEAMSGEVCKYNLNKPMNWNQYQLLENQSKELYLKSLVKEYDVKTSGISKMFGVSTPTAHKELEKYGLIGKAGVRQTGGAKERWERFLKGGGEEPALEVKYEKVHVETEPKHEQGVFSYAKMEIVGSNRDKIFNDLCAIMARVEGYGKLYKITLEVE